MSGPKKSDVIAKLHIVEQWILQQMEVIDKCRDSLPELSDSAELFKRVEDAGRVIQSEGDDSSRKLYAEARELCDEYRNISSDAERLRNSAENEMQQVSVAANELKNRSGVSYRDYSDADLMGDRAKQALEDYNMAYRKTLKAVDVKRKLESKLEQAVNKQMEVAAQKYLDSAKEEIRDVSVEKLEKWTHKGSDAKNALNAINKADSLIKSGKYDELEELVDEKLEFIRNLQEEMRDNQYRAKQQRDKARAIINALKEANYKDPEYYYPETEDGGEDVLGTLTIYAEGRGKRSLDVEIELDLGSDRMKLEYCRHDENGNRIEITEADENACAENLDALKGRLEDAGFDTPNTDYGRGRHAEGHGVKTRTVTKMREKTHIGGSNR